MGKGGVTLEDGKGKGQGKDGQGRMGKEWERAGRKEIGKVENKFYNLINHPRTVGLSIPKT